ncbi:MAG: diguanylate cyclase [Gammaproteobacteria bacterium]|nr:diguanylate cyclase [Gammaproteobacteria bacterium]
MRLKVNHFGEAGPVFPTILALMILTMFGVISMMLYTFEVLDQSQKENLYQRIAIAFEVEHQRQQDLLQEYTFWDEAHEKQIQNLDRDWVELNTGLYLHESYGIGMALAASGDHQPALAVIDGDYAEIDVQQLLNNGLRNLLENESFSAGDKSNSVSYLQYNGQVFMVGIDYFHDEASEIRRDDNSYMMIAKLIDQDFIDSLAELYKLPALALLENDVHADDLTHLVLADPAGQQLLQVGWEHTQLSDYLAKIIVFLVLITLILALLVRLIFVSHEKQRDQFQQKLQELANTDYLTGVHNRRSFMAQANIEFARANRSNHNPSLLLIDLDHFKKVNDGFGHKAGDMVLVYVAKVIQDNLRDFDIFARFGGEEFVILLPETTEDQAYMVAERLRELVENLTVTTDDNSVVNCTISIGLSHRRGDENLETMLARADEALYMAKSAGRNRCDKAA